MSTLGSFGESNISSDCPEDLSEVIDFSNYDLRTTIKLIILSGESRRIDVKRGSLFGSIYIKGGEIYRIITNDSEGDEAFFRILSWQKASHKDYKCTELLEPNVKISTSVFLDLLEKRSSFCD